MRRYESPDAQATWSMVLDLALMIVLSVLALIFAMRGDVARTILCVGALVLNVLHDILTEVRASRRLAETATLRRVR